MNGRKLLRAILWFLLIMSILAAAVAGYAWWQKDALLKALIDNLNESIEKPVQVEKVSLSLQKFPSVSLQMESVWALDDDGDSLLHVEEILLSSSLRYWIKGEYRIDKVSIKGGGIHLKKERDESWNYEQFIPKSNSSGRKAIELTELTLSGTQLIWNDKKENVFVRAFMPSLVFQSKSSKNIQVTSELKNTRIEQDNRSFNFDELDVEFHKSKGKWQTHIHLPQSAITLKQNSNNEQILFEGNTNGATEWLQRLSIELKEPFTSLEGNWSIQGSISTVGKSSGKISMSSSNLQLNHPDWSEFKAEAGLTLEIEPNKQNLIIDSIAFSKNDSWINVNGNWDIKSDLINLNGNGSIQLDELESIIPENLGANWKGNSTVELSLKGKAKDLDFTRDLSLKATVDKFGYTWSEEIQLRKTKGEIQYSSGTIRFTNLLTELNGQELFADGSLSNLNSAEDLNIQMRLRTQSLTMSTKESGSGSLKLELPRFTSSVIIEADELKIDKLKMSAVRISLQADSNSVQVERLFAQGLGGQFEAKGELKRNGEGFELQTEGELRKVAIDQLFAAFSDFGQNTLTSKQLEGTLSSDFQLQLDLDSSFEPEMETIKVIARTQLVNAELSNFKPLETVAENVQLDELNTLKISSHTQNWSIENQRVYLEKSLWKSNAIDVEISGIHLFDNSIDYQFILPINRLVSKRKSKMDEELEELLVEVQKRKEPKFYVQVTGTVDKPIVGVDKEGIKEGLKSEWKNQDVWKKDNPQEAEEPSGGLQFEWGEETDSIK